MRLFLIFIGSSLIFSCSSFNVEKIPVSENWDMAILAYTFRENTFFEAIDKAKELGFTNIGGYPGQRIGGGIDGVMDYKIDEDKRKKILTYLNKSNMKLVDFGVVIPSSREEWVTLFEFAEFMGIENIVSEPDLDQLPMISDLCDKYQIKVAIHNHAHPSEYWDPEVLMKNLEGKSEFLGVCADVGHWVRSGLDPIKGLRVVESRLIELHFKDVSAAEKDGYDVVWGTGVGDVGGMILELERQSFSGILSVEYESNPEDNLDEIRESLKYYHEQIR